MELTASELWSRILQAVQGVIPEHGFRTWLAGTRPTALSEHELLVEVPNQFHVQWVEDKFGPLLDQAASGVLGRPLRVSFVSGERFPTPPVPSLEVAASAPIPPPPQAPSHPPADGAGGGLNPRYIFERFVVGGDNQLAHAACRAVAERPARMYNPLFLYGGVGLGKTHLMHAIGNAVLAVDPRKRVAYVPSEQFTNELITCIQEGKMPEFRRRYRRMDILLVDDVHFLEKKERTQEEFFHTFNALYDAHKQLVLTSDRPPKEMPGLEQRLVSRFEWGLVADIQVPDYETRLAILRKKAFDDGLVLDPEVVEFIARSCTSSVRELEGALIKLLAYSSVKNQEITMPMATSALHGMLRPHPVLEGERISPKRIRSLVAERWGVEPGALASKRRTKDLTVPRQVAMYLMKELLSLSLVRIGEYFGGRDHSTVIHSIRVVEENMETDKMFRQTILELRELLSQ